jgi:ABC-2 type transport system permease protein
VCSQLAPTRRLALELASAVLVIALLLRIVADTSSRVGWLRWLTPLGWAEELRPFAGPRPAVLLIPAVGTVLLLAMAATLFARRDVGSGLLAPRDRARPRPALLRSTTAQALREERASLAGWVIGIGFYAVIVGLLSHSFSAANIPENLRLQLEKLGGSAVTTPSGALSFYFLFFALAISLFACSQIAAARREEADGRLETVLALPVGRRGWLAGRLALATGGAALLAFIAGLLSWAGSAVQGGGASLLDLVGAGANCLPVVLLFLSLGALAFAVLPRPSPGITYGVVGAAFVWELFGAVLGAPAWLLGLSPFHHLGLVPAQPFEATAAAAMLGLAAVAALAAVRLFERRDLIGA